MAGNQIRGGIAFSVKRTGRMGQPTSSDWHVVNTIHPMLRSREGSLGVISRNVRSHEIENATRIL